MLTSLRELKFGEMRIGTRMTGLRAIFDAEEATLLAMIPTVKRPTLHCSTGFGQRFKVDSAGVVDRAWIQCDISAQ